MSHTQQGCRTASDGKDEVRVKKIILAITALLPVSAIALFAGFILFRRPSMVSKCPDTLFSSKSTIYQIHPSKVIVKPWWGRHNVSAVFELPAGYTSSNFFMVNVGSMTYCGLTKPIPGQVYEGVYAKPGARIVEGNFRTRTAMWLILKGNIDQLQQPLNWMLVAKKHN